MASSSGALAASGLAVINAYLLGLVAAAAVTARRRDAPPARPEDASRLRFAIVVPAHDEEAAIGTTLEQLAGLDHPRDRLEVIVVADRCGDRTEAVAAAAGATVWARRSGEGGKGAALGWALGRLVAERPEVDAVVLIDADCAASPNLLSAVEQRLRAGADAVQVAYVAGNPDASWSAALRFASLTLMNVVRPLGKSALGLSCGLFGTGMAFSRRVLVEHPWTARSLIEDREYHLGLVASGIHVVFAPEASVSSAMPTSLRRSESQQLRWEAGRIPLLRAWTPRLLSAALRRRDARPLHAALEALVPPQALLLSANVVTLGVAVAAGTGPLRRLAAANVVAQGCYVAGGLALARAPASVWRSMPMAPLLALWKIGVLVRLWSGHGPRTWVRTPR